MERSILVLTLLAGFDFHANDESPGEWTMSGFDEDLEDLKDVVDWLYREWGYVVQLRTPFKPFECAVR